MGLSGSEKISTIRLFSRFDTIPACDGPTDGRTDGIDITISHVAFINEHGRAIKIENY